MSERPLGPVRLREPPAEQENVGRREGEAGLGTDRQGGFPRASAESFLELSAGLVAPLTGSGPAVTLAAVSFLICDLPSSA